MSMKQELKAGISALALAFALAMPGMALAEGDDPAPVDDGIAWAGGSPDFCESCGGEVVDDPVAGEDGAGDDQATGEDPGTDDSGTDETGSGDGDEVSVDPRDGCENCRGNEGDGTEVTDGDDGAGDGTVYDSTGFDETGVTVDEPMMEVTSTGGPDVRRDTGGVMARRGGEGNGRMQIRPGCVSETGPTLAFLCNQ